MEILFGLFIIIAGLGLAIKVSFKLLKFVFLFVGGILLLVLLPIGLIIYIPLALIGLVIKVIF